jgi:serine/threonine protein kinase
VAIKIEEKNHPIHILKNETRILEYLSKNGIRTQIPQVFWFGNCEDKICLVMTYFVGLSLEKQIEMNCLENIEIFMNTWMIDSLNILEKIHFFGVIHRDIKPDHFILSDVTKWVLIDFGFATFYLDQNNERTEEYIIGTPNYISINIHNGKKYKPIDDIWSLIYIYIRVLCPTFFYGNVEENNNGNVNIEETKEQYPLNHILNKQNQLRKHKKESFNHPLFWEKNPKIYAFIKILIDSSNIPISYNKLRSVFT